VLRRQQFTGNMVTCN